MIKIIIDVHRTTTTPSIAIYEVSVQADERSEWRETFGSEESVRAFIRGVKAGGSLLKEWQVEVVNNSSEGCF